MTSSGQWLARLQWALATAALAALLTAASMPLTALPLSPSAPRLILRSCGRLATITSPGKLVVIALTTFALLGVLRGTATLCGAVRGARLVTRLRGRRMVLCGHSVTVLATARPAAFTAGWMRPRTFISDGAVSRLSGAELKAVLAHEDHHRRRRDPLRLAVRRVLAETLFFLPGLRQLRATHDQLAEIAADRHANRTAGGDPRPLAAALLAFDSAAAAGAGISATRADRLINPQQTTKPCHRSTLTTIVAVALLGLLVVVDQLSAVNGIRVCAGTIAVSAAIASTVWRINRAF
jgi:Zn-dependent protease with chaperone function